MDPAQVLTRFIFTALYDDQFTARSHVKPLHFRLQSLLTSLYFLKYDCRLSSFYCGKKRSKYYKDPAVELNGKAVSKDVLQNFRIIKSTLSHKMLNATYPVIFIADDS